MNTIDISVKVDIILSILSVVLAAISVITVIITIRQNNKMIEGATRPTLSFYTVGTNTGNPIFWFVVRNFGHSTAQIKHISSSRDFKKFLLGIDKIEEDFFENKDPMETLKNAVIAPGQSRVCALDYDKCPDLITINVLYTSAAGKEYRESFTLNSKAGNRMITTKDRGRDSTQNISYTLQEMLQKSL